MKLGAILVAVLSTATIAGTSAAHSLVYTGTLSGLNESPANASAGTGAVAVTINLDEVTMRVEATFSGLGSGSAAAHIHCCLAPAGPLNVNVATTVPTFPGFPSGVTSGAYDQTFDLSLESSYNPMFVTGSGGTVGQALNALLDGLEDGNAYFNLHTANFPAGEIRANLLFSHQVPEPQVLALVALGLAGLSLLRRQRRAEPLTRR